MGIIILTPPPPPPEGGRSADDMGPNPFHDYEAAHKMIDDAEAEGMRVRLIRDDE